MSKIRIFKGWWTINDVKNNPNCLFVFGDNDVKSGYGGQAIIRDLPNAIGIPTKKLPTLDLNSFYNDLEFERNKMKISFAIKNVINESKKYKYVILPEEGLGTGLADLKNKAPETFKLLESQIMFLKNTL